MSAMAHPSLAAMVSTLHIPIARESLHERFTQPAVEFMRTCSSFVLQQKVAALPKIQTPLLNAFERILIMDSSCWDVHPLLKTLFPGCRNEANCKMQLCYEYLTGVISFYDFNFLFRWRSRKFTQAGRCPLKRSFLISLSDNTTTPELFLRC